MTMAEGFKRVLDDAGVRVGLDAAKGRKYKEMVGDLFASPEAEKSRILTMHGARLVLTATKEGRISWKDLAGRVVQEAQRLMAEAEARHALELEAFIKETKGSAVARADTAPQADDDEDGTAGK